MANLQCADYFKHRFKVKIVFDLHILTRKPCAQFVLAQLALGLEPGLCELELVQPFTLLFLNSLALLLDQDFQFRVQGVHLVYSRVHLLYLFLVFLYFYAFFFYFFLQLFYLG
jgi:hypothetical protein